MIDSNSINSLFDAEVFDPTGEKIGVVKQIYVEHEGERPLFVSVATGLFGSSETFVPLQDAAFDGHALHVPVDKATVKDAPRVDADETLSDEERDRLWEYYEAAQHHDDEHDRLEEDGDQRHGGGDHADDAGQDAVGLSGPGAGRDPSGAHAGGRDLARDGDAAADGAKGGDEDQQGVVPRRVRLRRHIVTVDQDIIVPLPQDHADGGDRGGRPR